ncbi:RNA polymerase sigma-70 factor (ECF subfamily) [Mucilaginibacter gracilis]|uniref:RNA polymerase sigma-70 factor (ECF subfamily) n=1 Tax=Mucilaginibacter gracilis TaxID=423350 RepID=A0A495J003_9SPHI|nr:sigma-70 family RNA polymerase sigma factor [Mucilaginibacter gracilis]RKR82306.1 RNA polymerase sigma-70 factor (ECF subfamily) [Mucilaginibacter gracilis]
MPADQSTSTVSPGNAIHPHGWVAAHADYLYSFALTRVNNPELAKDLVQETFLAALQKVKSFEGRSSERTWLTAILKNKVFDVYRKRSSGLSQQTSTTDAEQEQADFFDQETGHWNDEYRPVAFGAEAADPMESKEFAQILQKCMQKLPALWMAVFTMKHMDDTNTDNICAELKLTPNNFWVIIHRTKLNLRACLQKNWI